MHTKLYEMIPNVINKLHIIKSLKLIKKKKNMKKCKEYYYTYIENGIYTYMYECVCVCVDI